MAKNKAKTLIDVIIEDEGRGLSHWQIGKRYNCSSLDVARELSRYHEDISIIEDYIDEIEEALEYLDRNGMEIVYEEEEEEEEEIVYNWLQKLVMRLFNL